MQKAIEVWKKALDETKFQQSKTEARKIIEAFFQGWTQEKINYPPDEESKCIAVVSFQIGYDENAKMHFELDRDINLSWKMVAYFSKEGDSWKWKTEGWDKGDMKEITEENIADFLEDCLHQEDIRTEMP